jgi:agmatine deiminase
MTPKEAGFYMPAEWTPHERCWMMWPCREEVWPDMEATRQDFANVAHAIREFEPVAMTVKPKDEDIARNLLGSDIDILISEIDDSWSRDAGPCFLVDGKGNHAGVNFSFNAWGGKYHPFDGDDHFSSFVLNETGTRQFTSKLIAEGGGISVDGEGTILTTESCFPNPNRNPDWTKTEIEQELIEMLGGEKVIWLPGDWGEVETDGHVDGIAAFVAPGKVLVEIPSDLKAEHYDIMMENYQTLVDQTDAKGRELELVLLRDASDAESVGDIFCNCYVNSYLANGGVIMPKYGIPGDGQALEIYQSLFPDRKISQVSINNIALGGGGIHCITQQQPL